MKKTIFAGVLFFLLGGLSTFAQADIDIFLNDLNQQAATDRHSYNTRLSNQFGIPMLRTESIVRSVESPADAFMLLQLGAMSGKPYDSVLNSYKKNRKKGWGAMAQELGIKPGSPEFHALKRGDFVFSGKRGEKGYLHHEDGDSDKDLDNDIDKAKGKDKNKNKDVKIDTGAGKVKDKDLGKGKGKDKNTDVKIDTETGKGKGQGKNK